MYKHILISAKHKRMLPKSFLKNDFLTIELNNEEDIAEYELENGINCYNVLVGGGSFMIHTLAGHINRDEYECLIKRKLESLNPSEFNSGLKGELRSLTNEIFKHLERNGNVINPLPNSILKSIPLAVFLGGEVREEPKEGVADMPDFLKSLLAGTRRSTVVTLKKEGIIMLLDNYYKLVNMHARVSGKPVIDIIKTDHVLIFNLSKDMSGELECPIQIDFDGITDLSEVKDVIELALSNKIALVKESVIDLGYVYDAPGTERHGECMHLTLELLNKTEGISNAYGVMHFSTKEDTEKLKDEFGILEEATIILKD